MTLETNNNNTRLKIVLGILFALLIGLAAYTFTLKEENKEAVRFLEADKVEVQKELEALVTNYNEIIQDNELKDQDLVAARDRIMVLLDSVKDYKMNVSILRRYKVEIGRLKTERIQLYKRADSLVAVTERLAIEKDSTTVVLNQTIKVVDSVTSSNTEMSKSLEKGALIGITNLSAKAIIVRKSGKIKETQRSSRADKIKVCYTLAPNILAENGDRMLYVQVINPANNIIGDKAKITFDTGILSYSTTTSVYYENEALDVCAIVAAAEDDLIKGMYTINIFDAGRQIGSATVTLK
ncbi:MAG: cell division protein FtsB [Saprospiraceae bacterium]|jgi:cell division protein FtsB